MYAVFGATGNTGKVVADQLLAQGKQVRVIVRDPHKVESLRARGAKVVVATFKDKVALAAALQGVAGAYVMQPPNIESADMIVAAKDQADVLAYAIEEARVPHVVHLSSIGAQHENGTGPIAGLHYSEQRLRSATPALTSVRAPYFMENWATVLPALADGVLVSMLPLDKAIPMIATEDIGRIAATLLIEGPRGHQIVELEGPRALSPRDIAEVLSAQLSRPIVPTLVPMEAVAATFESFGFNARNAEIYREMFEAIGNGRAAPEGNHRVLRGHVTIEQFLRGLLAKTA